MYSIDTALNDFELPIVISSDNEYQSRMADILNRFLIHMKKVNNIGSETILSLEEDISSIIECLNLYYQADFTGAKKKIACIIKRYVNDEFIVSDINKSYAFRGMSNFKECMSVYENNKEIQNNYSKMNEPPLNFFKARDSVKKIARKDMLHIPFNNRGLVATRRFSMPGIPCLYLATSSLGCWIEMNMPQKDTFWVSSFAIKKELKVLNLCVQQHQINGACSLINNQVEYDLAMQEIKIWPLVCATSFSILEENRSFKSEYIVSQLLMQCLKEFGIDAIAYNSKKMVDFYAYPQCVNLAIPAISKGDGLYSDISNHIELTEAISFGELSKLKDPQISSKSYVNEIYGEMDEVTKRKSVHDEVNLMGEKISYSESQFGKYDNYLVSQKHSPFWN